MATSSRCLLPSQSEELSSLDMHSVPRGEIISDILLWKASTGRKLAFPDTISRGTGIKVENLPAAMANKTGARPRPQDDDDDDKGREGVALRSSS